MKMSDFSELKKRVETFTKEIKTFSTSLADGDDAEKQQKKYSEFRDKKKEYTKEIKGFEPAKKIMMLDSKKSGLLKSLQDELAKAEKAMIKLKIEVPKDENEDEAEKSVDKKGKNKKADEQKDEGQDKSKKDKKESSKGKGGKDDKKGKNTVEVVDEDRKPFTSAKKSAIENDFEDTEEEEESPKVGEKQAEKEEEQDEEEEEEDEDEESVEKTVAAQQKDSEKGKAEDKKSNKKDKKSKDKKKDKQEAEASKKMSDSKKEDKKSRKDSEKSTAGEEKSKKSDKKKKKDSGKKGKADAEEEDDAADEKDGGKSKTSKDSKKDKKDAKSKDGKSKKTEAEEENEDKEVTKEEKKDKRKSKEVEESKEDKKDKRKSKEVEDKEDKKKDKEEEPKEDKKDKRKNNEVEDKKDKKMDKETEEPKKEDKKDKKKGKETEDKKEDKKDKKDEKVDAKNDDQKRKEKEGKSGKKDSDKDSKAEKVKGSGVNEAAIAPSKGHTVAAAAAQAPSPSSANDASEDEEEEDEEFSSEPEDGGGTYEMIMTQQATQLQASVPSTSRVTAPAPATAVAAPTPAPRQKEVATKPAASTSTSAVGQLEEDDEFDEEEEEEEEASEYEFENMRTLGPNEPNRYESLQGHSDSDPDILSIQKGELLTVLKIGPDGWWLARNARGHEGLVPGNYLRLAPEAANEDDFDDEADDGSEFDEVTQADTTSAATGILHDVSHGTDELEGDESEDDVDYEDYSGALATEVELSATQNLVKQMIAASHQPPPGMPSGFRVSSLARWFYEGTKQYPGQQFTLQSMLHPKLAASCMSLQDGWGCTPQIRPVTSRIEKLVHLQKCQLMPSGLPAQVLDRFIRMCLFDGHGPVSNVHTVRAAVTPKDERVWTFGTRAADAVSGLDYGEAYMRYGSARNSVQLLLEATVVCKSENSEPMELSIGHVTVPLFDENGGPMPAKAFDLQLEGGTPFDRQQEVDSKLGQSGGQRGARSQSRIQLKLSLPNKETKEFMDTCPTTIVGNLANLQLHSLYRHVLASEISLASPATERSASAIYAPHLVQFLAIADQPDLMDVVRRRWNEFAKRDRAFRKPVASEVMKQEFIRIVKSTYFVHQLKDFQPYAFGNKTQEQLRANQIQDFLRKIATDQSAVNFSLAADLIFEPFSMDEVALPVIGQFSVPVLPLAVE